jgi:hypothetical protein
MAITTNLSEPRYLTAPSAHAEIAQICCVYLLDPELWGGELNSSKLQDFPLAHFSALFWHHHCEKSQDEASRLYKLIERIFVQPGSFSTLIKLHNMVDRPWDKRVRLISWDTTVRLSLRSDKSAAPLYFASYLGFSWIAEKLLAPTSDEKKANEKRVNAQGGRYGNALQAASVRGHEAVVKMLLDKGAEVNAQGGHYGNALYAASSRGHEAVVKMLLVKGADVNMQGGYHGNALQAASSRGHEAVVKALLEKRADGNAQGEEYGNALQAASSGGHEAIVKMLIDKGAEVNAQGG